MTSDTPTIERQLGLIDETKQLSDILDKISFKFFFCYLFVYDVFLNIYFKYLSSCLHFIRRFLSNLNIWVNRLDSSSTEKKNAFVLY